MLLVAAKTSQLLRVALFSVLSPISEAIPSEALRALIEEVGREK